MRFERAPDLRVAFLAAPDGPDVVASLEDLYTLVTPGSLKIGRLDRDDRLSVLVIVLEIPLQVPVMMSTDNNREERGYVQFGFFGARKARQWQTARRHGR